MRRLSCCWTTATRSSRRPEAGAAILAALALSACSPGAPPGVDRGDLDDAVSRAIGDPNTCVLIAEAGSGRRLYQYNSATTCDRAWPACDQPKLIKTADLLDRAVKTGAVVKLSCDTAADASRGVGWAAGPIAGTKYIYAAVMEGDRAFPGRMMADRLATAFHVAKVSKGPNG